jgi:hypothetical protein|tara:strand:- start:196 stop:465 length:270 start_codon:yes stop_codon:yes gene_type:complete
MEITYINWLANKLQIDKQITDMCGDDPNMQQNMRELLEHECNDARQAAYPSIVEFIDAYYWERKGDSTRMDNYMKVCDEVKDKYPKPSL